MLRAWKRERMLEELLCKFTFFRSFFFVLLLGSEIGLELKVVYGVDGMVYVIFIRHAVMLLCERSSFLTSIY